MENQYRRKQYIADVGLNLTIPIIYGGAPTYALIAANNYVETGPLMSLVLIMPTLDGDGNPLSDGIELSISFGEAITILMLSGAFRNPPPTSITAGQVLNFSYNTNTNSWWNA